MAKFAGEPFAFNTHETAYGPIDPEYFEAEDGLKIAYYHIKPVSTPKAAAVFIHGAGAHCRMSDYQGIGQGLSRNGIECYLIDLRGHGNSEGKRGAAKSRESVWKDIRMMVERARESCPGIPVCLMGHSAGAGTAINYATWKDRIECDGYAFISPYLGYRAGSYRGSMRDDPFATADIPLFVANILSFGLLCGDRTAVHYNYPSHVMERDPLIVNSITCKMSKACTLWNPRRQFGMIRKPVGLFIGSEDELFDPDKVTAYAGYLGNDVKPASHVEILPGLKHLTILPEISARLIKFIDGLHLPSGSPPASARRPDSP